LRPGRAEISGHENNNVAGHVFDDHVNSFDVCVDYEVMVFLKLERNDDFING
jgi:hypothetical protein